MPNDDKNHPREKPSEQKPERENPNLNENSNPDIHHDRNKNDFNKGFPDRIEYIIRPSVSENPPSKDKED